MGKLLIIILVMVTIILASVLVSIQSKSGDIADLLSSNMSEIKAKSLGNEALIYGIKQLSTGNLSVSETEMKQAFSNFDVIDGTIDSIKYVVSSGDTMRITSYVTANINGKETQYESIAEVYYSDANTFQNIITTSNELHGALGNANIVGNVIEHVELDFEEVFGISLARIRRLANYDYVNPSPNMSPVAGITYIETSGNRKAKVTTTGWSGSGILIVDGVFELTGGYFEGIIWVESGEFRVAGGAEVRGAIFINDDPEDIYDHVRGTCDLTYDQAIVDALLANYNISVPSSQLKILTWNN